MKLLNVTMPKAKINELILGGCFHLGNPAHDKDCMSHFLEACQSHKYVLMGDLIEGICPFDKRFHAETHGETVAKQIRYVVGLFWNVRKNCLGAICGNHEDSLNAKFGNIVKELIIAEKSLNVMYLHDLAVLTLQFGKGKSRIALGHPYFSMNASAGTSLDIETAKKRTLRRRLDRIFSRKIPVRAVWHMHQGIVDPPHSHIEPKLDVEDDGLKEDYEVDIPNWTISGPAMFRTYDANQEDGNYASRHGYPPVDLGWMGLVYENTGTLACVRQYRSNGKIKREWEPEIVG